MVFNYSLLKLTIMFIICVTQTYQKSVERTEGGKHSSQDYQGEYWGSHAKIIERYFAKRKDWKTSNLGSVLFKNMPPGKFLHNSRNNTTFTVLLWKHWDNDSLILDKTDPLEECSVENCIFTENENLIDKADVVLINTVKMPYPEVKYRNKDQRWIVTTVECPRLMFPEESVKPTFKDLAIMTNWTMVYRTDADVPIPFGRTLPLPKPVMTKEQYIKASLADIIPHWTSKKHNVLVVSIMSHRVQYRMQLLEELKMYMSVDVYGAVATNNESKYVCPGHYFKDCKHFDQYMFYLALENNMCHQYITEKVFYNAFLKGAIPVVVGAPLKDYETLLPPKSFIYAGNFASIEGLATHLKNVAEDEEALREYHRWRNHFEVVNEHGYFGTKSVIFCRVCEALNYNDEVSIYSEDDVKTFFDPKINCVGSDNFQG